MFSIGYLQHKRINMKGRVSEAELFKPALQIIASYQNGITTSQLIKELMNSMKPVGEDLYILKDRNDVKFTQKVRNLISHRYNKNSIIKNGYVQYIKSYPSGILKITNNGKRFLAS